MLFLNKNFFKYTKWCEYIRKKITKNLHIHSLIIKKKIVHFTQLIAIVKDSLIFISWQIREKVFPQRYNEILNGVLCVLKGYY